MVKEDLKIFNISYEKYYYKTVSGNVWEDTDADNTDNERLGNGMRDDDEKNGIKGVKVELYKNNGTDLVTLYRITGTGEEAIIENKLASTYTDENGNYSFTNPEDGTDIPFEKLLHDDIDAFVITDELDRLMRCIVDDAFTKRTAISNNRSRKGIIKKSSGWLQSLDFYISAQYVGIGIRRFS